MNSYATKNVWDTIKVVSNTIKIKSLNAKSQDSNYRSSDDSLEETYWPNKRALIDLQCF